MSYPPTITSTTLDLLLDSPFAPLYERLPRVTRLPQDICYLVLIYLCDQWIGWQDIPQAHNTRVLPPLSTHTADIIIHYGQNEWNIDITGNMLQRGLYQRYGAAYYPMQWNLMDDIHALHKAVICGHARDIMRLWTTSEEEPTKLKGQNGDEVEIVDDKDTPQQFIHPDLQISIPSLFHGSHNSNEAWGILCNPTITWTYYRMFWARGVASRRPRLHVGQPHPTSFSYSITMSWYVAEIHLLAPQHWLVLQIQPRQPPLEPRHCVFVDSTHHLIKGPPHQTVCSHHQ